MNEDDWWKGLKDRLKVFLSLAARIVLDGAFLALWVALQWGIDKWVITFFELTGAERWVLLAFQVVFGVSTLATVLAYVAVDLGLILADGVQQVRKKLRAAA